MLNLVDDLSSKFIIKLRNDTSYNRQLTVYCFLYLCCWSSHCFGLPCNCCMDDAEAGNKGCYSKSRPDIVAWGSPGNFRRRHLPWRKLPNFLKTRNYDLTTFWTEAPWCDKFVLSILWLLSDSWLNCFEVACHNYLKRRCHFCLSLFEQSSL